VVMESAQDLERFDAPGPLNRARNRRIRHRGCAADRIYHGAVSRNSSIRQRAA